MADPGRANLLAAIRAKGQKPAVEVPQLQSKPAPQQRKVPPLPVNQNASSSSAPPSGSELPRGPAPAALAMKAALAQMGGNIRANLKPTNETSDTTESKPAAPKPALRSSPLSKPPPIPPKTAPKGPLAFSAADLQAQIKLRAAKKAAANDSSTPAPDDSSTPAPKETSTSSSTAARSVPPIDTSQLGLAGKSVLSYRSGVLTKIDAPAKLKQTPKLTPKPIVEETKPEDVRPKSSARSIDLEVTPDMPGYNRSTTPKKDLSRNSSRELKSGVSPPRKSASRDLRRGLSSKGSEASDKPALPSLISQPARTDSVRRAPPPVSAIPRSTPGRPRRRSDKSSKPPLTPSSSSPSIATPTPSSGIDIPNSPPAISPPSAPKNGTQSDSAGKFRLLTEPSEIQKAWRKLSCRVLRDGEVPGEETLV